MRKRWIQDPDTHELVEAELYQRRETRKGPQIMPDIKPFVSVCGDMAGKEISSRSALREFEKRNGVVQIGNDKSIFARPDPKQEAEKHRQSVLHDLRSVVRDFNA